MLLNGGSTESRQRPDRSKLSTCCSVSNGHVNFPLAPLQKSVLLHTFKRMVGGCGTEMLDGITRCSERGLD